MNTQLIAHETFATNDHHETNRLAAVLGWQATAGLQRISAACISCLKELKEELGQQFAAEYGAALTPALIRQAVTEADSLAATTPFPGLFLPALAEEKVRTTAAWSHRQAAIRRQSLALAA